MKTNGSHTRGAGEKLGVVDGAAAGGRVAVTGPLLAETQVGEQLRAQIRGDETEKGAVVILVTGPVDAQDLASVTVRMAAGWIAEAGLCSAIHWV